MAADAGKDDILAAAKESVSKWLEGKEIVKEIVVPKKLVNLVIGATVGIVLYTLGF